MGLVNGARAGLFRGPQSLRLRGEWALLAMCIILVAVVVPGLARLIGNSFAIQEFALIIIGGMLLISLGRGRLLGSSIRVHEKQFGDIAELVTDCARTLGTSVPQVFVRDDPFVPLVAIGIGEPYALIISAQWVGHLKPQEMRFLVGRELAHIAAGHTRLTSLLSTNGRENPLVAFAFGAWLRRIEYTADRVGLLCCDSLENAYDAIAVSAFHALGRTIDHRAFAEQRASIESDQTLRMGEWLSATPYATNRMHALAAFTAHPLYAAWRPRFESGYPVVAPASADRSGGVPIKAFASFPRRIAAFTIDSTLVSIIFSKAVEIKADLSAPAAAVAPGAIKAAKAIGELAHKTDDPDAKAGLEAAQQALAQFPASTTSLLHLPHITFDPGLFLFAYVILLVAIAGQTFGMMVMDLRVVTDRFSRVGLGRAIARYVVGLLTFFFIYGFVRMFSRVQPFEKMTGTRLVQGNAVPQSTPPLFTEPQPQRA